VRRAQSRSKHIYIKAASANLPRLRFLLTEQSIEVCNQQLFLLFDSGISDCKGCFGIAFFEFSVKIRGVFVSDALNYFAYRLVALTKQVNSAPHTLVYEKLLEIFSKKPIGQL